MKLGTTIVCDRKKYIYIYLQFLCLRKSCVNYHKAKTTGVITMQNNSLWF